MEAREIKCGELIQGVEIGALNDKAEFSDRTMSKLARKT